MSKLTTSYAELRALAEANERMVELFRWLDSQQNVANTTRGVDIRVYTDAVAVEHFVEGDLITGYGICYWLETRLHGDACTVEASVFAQTPDGQITLRDTSINVEGEAELAGALLKAIDELWRLSEQDLQRVFARSPAS